jgi:hypothetical protein
MPSDAGTPPDHDESVEQAFFFRTFRERLGENLAAQDILTRAHEEVLSSTRLPMAVEFLATELKHTGRLASGFARLAHYFTPFQTFVVGQAEDERQRLTMPKALEILEKEATYKAGTPTPAGLFVYQYETIARNRLGYDAGLAAVEGDPVYSADWRAYIGIIRRQAGVFDFADLVYARSEQFVQDERRRHPGWEPPVPPLFSLKEGKIARASKGRDPLFLFAALQRQLGYPQVPRFQTREDLGGQFAALQNKVKELESRLRMLEAEQRGTFDPTQFGKPDLFKDDEEDKKGS